MVTRQSEDSFSIHTLIHTWARQRFDADAQRGYAQKAVKILAEAVRRDTHDQTAEDVRFERKIRLHANTVLKISDGWSQQDVETPQWVQIASLYEAYGQYDEAERFYKLALKGRDPLQDDADQEMLDIASRLAKVYRLQSHPALAIPIYRQYLKKAGDSQSLATARVQVQLGTAIHNQGEYLDAEKLLRKGIDVLETHLGRHKVETLAARDNLASTLLRLKQDGKAEKEYRQVLEQLRETVGMDNPYTMRTLQNLARYYMVRGDFEKALPMFKEALELRQCLLGLDHPSTLRTWHNLAYCHLKLRQMEEAENMYAVVVAAKEKVLGLYHYDTLNAMQELAFIYHKIGDSGKAEELLKKTLGGLHKDTDKRRQDMVKMIQKVCAENGLNFADLRRAEGDGIPKQEGEMTYVV